VINQKIEMIMQEVKQISNKRVWLKKDEKIDGKVIENYNR
jgi:hypothetical protein